MKKCFVLLSVATFFCFSINAQIYKNAIGIRLGANSPAISNGITFKHFISDKNAVEAIVSINNGVGFCALYQWYNPIVSVENLQWFVGAGAYAASKYKIANIGVAGMVGVDYKFATIPLIFH